MTFIRCSPLLMHPNVHIHKTLRYYPISKLISMYISFHLRRATFRKGSDAIYLPSITWPSECTSFISGAKFGRIPWFWITSSNSGNEAVSRPTMRVRPPKNTFSPLPAYVNKFRKIRWILINLLVTRCSKFNIQQLYFCPHCIYVLCKQRFVPLKA
jgi:hypothetical protein